MSRKDYIRLAAALRTSLHVPTVDDYSIQFRVVREVARALADTLAQDNPRFNRSRFLEAAGVE